MLPMFGANPNITNLWITFCCVAQGFLAVYAALQHAGTGRLSQSGHWAQWAGSDRSLQRRAPASAGWQGVPLAGSVEPRGGGPDSPARPGDGQGNVIGWAAQRICPPGFCGLPGNLGYGWLVEPLLKRCPRCGMERPRGWFRRNASKVSGYSSWCRECEKPGRAARAATRRERAVGRYSAEDVKRLWERQGGRCACGCGWALHAGYHVDHIVALARGGRNEAGNLQLLAPACNLRKGMK
jgi:5-methylcytosine-specific restriction endonuclease McrA